MFKMYGPVYNFLSKVFDIFLISMIWLLCCVPVVTAGAATTALYYAVVKVIRRERGYLTKEYLRSLKENFKQATILWLIIGGLACLFYFLVQFTPRMEADTGRMFQYVYYGLGFLLLCIGVYVFPVLSRFSMSVVQILRSSVYMAVKHLPSTVGMVIIVIWAVFIGWMVPPALMFMPGIAVWMISYMMERILKIYTPKSEETSEAEGEEEAPKRDEWYLE